ncbi:MAG: hypothetical protein ACK44D_02850 [Bacteroidia bacterium]
MVKHNESKGRAATNMDVMKMKSSMTVFYFNCIFGQYSITAQFSDLQNKLINQL